MGENVINYLARSKSTSDVMLHPKTIYPREKNEQARRLWVWGRYVM